MPTKKAVVKKDAPKAKRPLNAWQLHVKATQALHPDMKLTEILKEAKKTYKK